MFNKYKILIKKINSYFNDSNFDDFKYTFPLKIKEEFLSIKNIKINKELYNQILKLSLQFKIKIEWLKNEYQFKNQEILNSINNLNNIEEEIFKDKNLLLENIIQSNELIYSNNKYIKFNYLFKENFIIKENKIIPLLYDFQELKFDKEINSPNKITLNINQKKIVSNIELNFDRNIDSEIIISYKEKQNTEIKFTTNKIKLSKNKKISLNFQDCSQIIIYSNSNFINYLRDIKIFGSDKEIDKINLKGIIEIPKYKKILINSDKSFSFFQYYDNKDLIPIENNLINEIKTNKILFTINTDEVILDEFKIFGIGEIQDGDK